MLLYDVWKCLLMLTYKQIHEGRTSVVRTSYDRHAIKCDYVCVL